MYLKAQVTLIYGTKDVYLNSERIAEETSRAQNLFGNQLKIIPFDGTHEVNVELIKSLV